MGLRASVHLGYKKFNKDFKSSIFKESKKIIFVSNMIWDSFKFYFKKTKSIKVIDFISSDDFNGFQSETKESLVKNSKDGINLK